MEADVPLSGGRGTFAGQVPVPTAEAGTRHRVTWTRSSSTRGGDGDLSAELESARRGDEASFARIFREVHPGLLRYLSVTVGSDAEDIAAETWSRVCRDLPTFRGDFDGFRGWIVTIARHRAIDHLRAIGRHPVAPVPVEDLHARDSCDSAETVAMESLSTSSALRMIADLPPDQAEAILLRTVMGLDAKAAGRVLGKRAGAVRTAAYRGLKTLALREPTHSRATVAPDSRVEPARQTTLSTSCDTSGPADGDEAR